MGFHVFYIFIRCLGQQPRTPLNFVIGLLFLHTSFSSVPFPNLYEVETSHKVRYLSTYRYIPTTQTPLCSDNLNQYFVFAILRKTVRLEETTPDSNLVHKCTGNLSLCSPTEEFKPFGHFRNRKKKFPWLQVLQKVMVKDFSWLFQPVSPYIFTLITALYRPRAAIFLAKFVAECTDFTTSWYTKLFLNFKL